MKQQPIILFSLILFSLFLFTACTPTCKKADIEIDHAPVIFPDYTQTTLPYNIAPPNFKIMEEGDAYQVEIRKDNQTYITCHSKSSSIQIPIDDWKAFVSESKDKTITFRIYILQDKKWSVYKEITNVISAEAIDPYLSYRLLYPGYELWNELGIYQRDITTFSETPILENKEIGKQCINCHTYNKNDPDQMMLHIRGAQGGTLIYNHGRIEKVNTKAKGLPRAGAYSAWHPSGKYIAFAMNDIKQYFHATGKKQIEVCDLSADIILYRSKGHIVVKDSNICSKEYMETFPNWDPKGKKLYFCRAKSYHKDTPLDQIRYDLCVASFDQKNETFGKPQILYPASEKKKSVSFPRISPDGKHLMFTLSDYGNFSIWHPESELALYTIKTGKVRLLSEVNSTNVESFHNWSSTGKWFVFSSKRLDGLWARPFIASFDSATGKATKPFVLPQRDPDFYNLFTKTYNLPELMTSKVTIGKLMPKAIKQKAIQTTLHEN